ncbi:hypothetical protein ACFFQ5_20545 [Pseudomonas brassicacearum]|uniref:hypothetical protein n=1 Tax=Pseudomonas brassicacearum TaxID=930166 RepID=UPI00087DA424|nr:hypothetical protein [Pseudomonas brassicacearum]KAB0528844.1 hypothetical protein F7R20_04880 [Pseudomonas brassicacearum subsp. brassicacearum]NJP58930.1 hypothetical protein [Pseudomonas brassicacearum]SDP09019.1 hypothetical protein SAMN04490180_0299 [Pseudomonas brassicacearum]
MLENLKHIKNPLTLISIFAGAAELGGAAVLPFISESNQELYIYFLIFFPIYTVTLFFATLNFNHRTLYAPSDYKDENNFVAQFGRATAEELVRKLTEETKEVQADAKEHSTTQQSPPATETSNHTDAGDKPEASQPSPSPEAQKTTDGGDSNQPDNPPADDASHPSDGLGKLNEPNKGNKVDQTSFDERYYKDLKLPELSRLDPKYMDLMEPYEREHQKLMANVVLIEKLAISKLSEELNINFKEDVTFRPSGSTVKYVFDAANYSNQEAQVVEVKLFTNRFDPKRFLKTLEKAHNLSRTFTSLGRLTMHLVIVLERMNLDPWEIRDRMKEVTSDYGFDIFIHITTTTDLQKADPIFY